MQRDRDWEGVLRVDDVWRTMCCTFLSQRLPPMCHHAHTPWGLCQIMSH